MGMVVEDGSVPVELDVAALQKKILQELPGPLDTGFCPREGKAESLCQFLLGEAFELSEQQRFAVAIRELIDHFPNSHGKLFHHVLLGRHLGRFFLLSCFVRREACAVVVGDRISRYLKDPALQFRLIAERIDAGMDFQKYVLEYVVGSGLVGNALQDEKSEARAERLEKLFRCAARLVQRGTFSVWEEGPLSMDRRRNPSSLTLTAGHSASIML